MMSPVSRNDFCCRLELPYPKENPFKERTPVMKASSNPEYNFKCIMPINPKDKSFQRACKRQSVKVEVWAKGGFFRSDNLVGTVQVRTHVASANFASIKVRKILFVVYMHAPCCRSSCNHWKQCVTFTTPLR